MGSWGANIEISLIIQMLYASKKLLIFIHVDFKIAKSPSIVIVSVSGKIIVEMQNKLLETYWSTLDYVTR